MPIATPVDPTVWNSLGNDLRDPDLSLVSFGRLLNTKLFRKYSETLCDSALHTLTSTFDVDVVGTSFSEKPLLQVSSA